MKLLTRSICKLSVNREMCKVRSKFTKAAILKTVNEPLVLENFKISDKLKEGQVNKSNLLLLALFFISKS